MAEKEETKESKTAGKSASTARPETTPRSASQSKRSILAEPFCSVHGVRGCTKHEKK